MLAGCNNDKGPEQWQYLMLEHCVSNDTRMCGNNDNREPDPNKNIFYNPLHRFWTVFLEGKSWSFTNFSFDVNCPELSWNISKLDQRTYNI